MKDGFIQLTLAGEDYAQSPLLVFLVPEKVEAIEVACDGLDQGAKTTIFCESSRNYNVVEAPEEVMKLYLRAMWATKSMTSFKDKRGGLHSDGPVL